jgi:TonB family protein
VPASLIRDRELSGVWAKSHLAAYRRNDYWFRYEARVGEMKSGTARNTYATTAHLHARRQTLKHPIVWSLVLSAGLHAAMFAGADRLHPSDPIPVALATDLRAIITIESRAMGNQITQASSVPHSTSLEPALSAMQPHHTRLRQVVNSHTQKTLAMKQGNRLQAQQIQSLQPEKTTVTSENSRLSVKITRLTSSHKTLQVQYNGLARAHQTTLAENEQLNQASDHLQQVHKAQVEKNRQLRRRALTQTDQITAAKERETLIEMDKARLTASVSALSASHDSVLNATRESELHVQTLEKRATKSSERSQALRNELAATSAATRRDNARRDNKLERMTREVDTLTKPHPTATQLSDTLRAEIKKNRSTPTMEQHSARVKPALAHAENGRLQVHQQQTTDQLHHASITETTLRSAIDRPDKRLTANADNRPIAKKRTTTAVTASPTSGNASSNQQPRPAAGNPKPVYPRLAIKRRLQGDVILTVNIQPTGTISTVTLKRSSGFKLLDSAAINAVRHWRYEPLPETAIPESRSDDIPINFRLKSKT